MGHTIADSVLEIRDLCVGTNVDEKIFVFFLKQGRGKTQSM